MRVFVSWRGTDKEVKNRIVEKLRAGLPDDTEVWESDEDCISDFSEECIQAIRESQVFVVIISDAAMEPSYVHNEVQEARLCEMQGKLNMLIFGITDTPLSARLAGNLNHISDVNRVARMAGTDEGYDALVRKVNRLLTLRKEGKPEKPYDVTEPEIAGVSLGGPGFFVEGSRDEKMKEIAEAFEKSNILFATQISGYGKKSVVRKYAEIKRGDYKEIIAIHTACSSLTDFFISALHFKNVNEEVYEGLDERGVILKKAEFLSKLDEKTLIIVPNIEIGKKDGEFIFDVLSGIRARIIFITERLSKSQKDILPAVEVGRMEDRYLKELFFHYYTLASADEEEELTDCLYDFFRDIGGHTKSVELVASALDEECDIYPEDIPGLFKEMNLTEMSELGQRIFGVVSEMYDIRNFSDNERRTLLIASLIATAPIDRKKFIGVVKEAGAFDSETIKKLEQLRWLDCDTAARTVSIDPTLASVCLKKIPMEKPLLYRCISLLFADYLDKATDTSYVGMSETLRRLSSCLRKGGLEKISAVLDCLDTLICQAARDTAPSDIPASLFEEAKASLSKIEDKECKDNLSFLISQTSTTVKAASASSNRKLDTDVYDGLISTIITPEFMEVFDVAARMTSDERILLLIKGLKSVVYSGNFRKLISTYIPTVLDLIEEDDPNIEITEAENILVHILTKLGFMLASSIPSSSPMACPLCRTAVTLDNYYGSFSPTERYTASLAYLKCLTDMKELTDETECAFSRALSAIDEAKRDKFLSVADFFSEKNYLVTMYVKLLAKHRPEEALKTLTEHIKPDTVSGDEARALVECIENAAMSLLERGDCLGYVKTVREILIGTYSADTDRRYKEQIEAVNGLIDIMRSVENPEAKNSFDDGGEEYLDYYKAYSGSTNSKRDTQKYIALADKAKSIDLCRYTREEMIAEAENLRAKAALCRDVFEIAPMAFALVSEAGWRVLGYRHHYVQYVGGAAILDGKIAQLQNGEGKTYTIPLAAVTRALFGECVTVADMSDYLAKRNYDNMRGVYEYLGINIGFCSGRYDTPEALLPLSKSEVLYGDMASLIFAKMHSEGSLTPRVTLRTDAIIVDEADQAMIEKAAAPFSVVYHLDIPVSVLDLYKKADEVREKILSEENTEPYFTYQGSITLKSEAYELITDMLDDYLSNLPPEAEKTVVSATRAGLLANFYEEGKDYFLDNGLFVYEEKTTGKFTPFSPEMQYFLAIKENIPLAISTEKIKLSRPKNLYLLIEYVKSFSSVAGTTATAISMKEEFNTLYSIDVFDVPTNAPVIRRDYAPEFFFSEKAKNEEILALTKLRHEAGQPMLIITSSIQSSLFFSKMLKEIGIENTVLNAKTADKEAEVLTGAGIPGRVTVATALANRGIDILLGGDPRRMAFSHLVASGKEPRDITRAIYSAESEDGELSVLKDNYLRLVSMYRQTTERDRELADSLGGLCVIGTECFDDLRIEQQVRGRSGRQGKNGESYVFYSIDDKAVKELFGGRYEGIKTFLLRLGAQDLSSSLGILMKSVRSSRLRLQYSRYGWLGDLPELATRVPKREKILAIREAFGRDKKEAARELFREYISTNESYLAHLENAKPLNSPSRLYTRLYLYAGDLKNTPKRRYPDLLCRAFDALISLPSDNGNFFDRLYTLLDTVWANYIGKMEEEIKAARSLWSGKRLKKHLAAFSDKIFATEIEKAIESATELLYSSQTKKITDGTEADN